MKLYALLLYVQSLEGSLRFYRDVLGLPVVQAEPGHFAELSLGDALLCLHQSSSPQQRLPTGSRPLVLQLQTGDVDMLTATIRSAGYHVAAGPSNRDYGLRQLDLADPDGYRIALVQPLESLGTTGGTDGD